MICNWNGTESQNEFGFSLSGHRGVDEPHARKHFTILQTARLDSDTDLVAKLIVGQFAVNRPKKYKYNSGFNLIALLSRWDYWQTTRVTLSHLNYMWKCEPYSSDCRTFVPPYLGLYTHTHTFTYTLGLSFALTLFCILFICVCQVWFVCAINNECDEYSYVCCNQFDAGVTISSELDARPRFDYLRLSLFPKKGSLVECVWIVDIICCCMQIVANRCVLDR